MVDNDMPGAWPVWTPGAPLAAFIKVYMVSAKKIFLCFSNDAPGVGPVWTPGARLAGFIAGFIYRGPLYIATHKI